MRLLIFRLTTALIMSLQLVCCGDFLRSGYIPELPQPPEPWVSLLGEPHWRLEWQDSEGRKRIADILPGETVEIELPTTWTNPVTAWPYWPGYNLNPGLFRPAGALFPLDVSGEHIRLSWKAGVDTVFYQELAVSNKKNISKMPAYFDWPRFRELFSSEKLKESVRKDPWLIDWRSVAEKTINSNFDQRRLVPETAVSTAIPVPSGPWYGASPFEEPLYFMEGKPTVFPVRPGLNVWISTEGILRINGKTWMFKQIRNEK